VNTRRDGAAAKAGHDLLIHVTDWEATLESGSGPAGAGLVLEADATSLRVRKGTGGIQALGEDDMANIQQTIDDEVLKRQAIVFRSTQVQPGEGDSVTFEGDLTLAGQTHPIAFDLVVAGDGRVTGSAVVKQSDWGIKPYSTLFGALKVADEVEVTIDARLPDQSR
jgi:polyisoprenoid-binding protein YceI